MTFGNATYYSTSEDDERLYHSDPEEALSDFVYDRVEEPTREKVFELLPVTVYGFSRPKKMCEKEATFMRLKAAPQSALNDTFAARVFRCLPCGSRVYSPEEIWEIVK